MSNVYHDFVTFIDRSAEEFREDLEAEGLGGYDDLYERAHSDADGSEYVIYSFWGAEMVSNFPSQLIGEAEDALWGEGESFTCIRTHLCRLAYWVTYNSLVEAYEKVWEEYEARSEVAANS